MNKIELLKRLSDIEWDDFEVKEAHSELPKNIWETVSAFSNAAGGWIVLGVSKKGKKFDILGVKNAEKQEQDFTTVLRSCNNFVNMLMHADYFSTIHSTIRVFTNRIVFQNPGRFDISISEWHKNAISKPRNPVIARLFRWAKLAENAGFGYDKMLTWKYKVEFCTNIDYSEATFYLVEKIPPQLPPPITELEEKLLGIIKQNPKGNRKDYAVKLGISEGVIKEYTTKLKQKGIIERIGNNRTGYWEIKINN